MNAIAEMFERNITSSQLREPVTSEYARARRITALLVETLAGYAFGIVARGQRIPSHVALHRDPDLGIDEVLAGQPIRLTAELRQKLSLRFSDLAAHLSMFIELNDDSRYGDRLAIEISTGWKCACAAIERSPINLDELPLRARKLWEMWSALAGNPVPKSHRDPAQLGGYITRVG